MPCACVSTNVSESRRRGNRVKRGVGKKGGGNRDRMGEGGKETRAERRKGQNGQCFGPYVHV